jgi:hypothetical protein
MQKTRTVLAIAAGIAAATAAGAVVTFAATDARQGGTVAVDMARGIIAGVILGSNVWPYQPSLVPADVQARVLLRPTECTWSDQCGGYGYAAATPDPGPQERD